jgi:hypothetical protein
MGYNTELRGVQNIRVTVPLMTAVSTPNLKSDNEKIDFKSSRHLTISVRLSWGHTPQCTHGLLSLSPESGCFQLHKQVGKQNLGDKEPSFGGSAATT